MVSNSQVMSDSSSLSTLLSKYMSLVSELSSSWKGPSYDNFVSKANEFYSSFSSAIESQMSNFGEACSLYEKYRTAKANYNISTSNYNSCVANKDNSGASKYSALIREYSKEMNDLKGQIEASLSAAGGRNLTTASNVSSAVSGGITSGTPSLNLNLNLSGNGSFATSFSKSDKNGIHAFFTDSDGKTYTIYSQGEIFRNQGAWGVSWDQNDKCTRCSVASVLSGYTADGAMAALNRNAGFGSNNMVETINSCSDGKLTAQYVGYSSDKVKEITSNGGHVLIYVKPTRGKSGTLWTYQQHCMAILDYRDNNGGEIFVSTSGRQPDNSEELWVPYDEFDNCLLSSKIIEVDQVK